CKATIAPCGKAEISRADEMMQRCPLAERSGRDLAAGAVHSGQPPTASQPRPGWIGHIDDRQSVVDETFEMDRYVGIAATHPPDPVRAEAGHVQEGNLARSCRLRDVEHAQTRGEWLLGLH